MKKLLILLLLVSGFAKAQPPIVPGYTGINSGYIWYKGGFMELSLPAYGDTALQPGQWRRAGAVLVDTSGSNKGLYFWMDGKWNLVAAGALAVTNIATNNGSGIVGGPITSTGTLAIDTLLTIATKDWVNSQGFGTGSGGSGNPNSNVGSAYRFAIPNTNNIKTFAAGFGGSLDSATSNQLQYTVDSSTIQKKLAFTAPVIKNNNTISLQGAADGTNRVYGQAAHGVWGMQRVFPFDTTSGSSNLVTVKFNKTTKQFVGVDSTAAGGGGSSASMGKMNFTIGGVGAPAAGDSVLTSTYLIGKDIDVYVNSDLVDSTGLTTTSSYTFDNTTGAITFKLAGGPGFVTGDHVEIRAWPTANVYTIPMPPVWSSFAYETRTGGTLTKVGNVYTASSSGNWNHTGLSSTPFTGDGRVRMIVPNLTTDIFAVLGLDATNAEQDYSTIDAGVVVYGSGDVKKNEGGAQTSVGTITAGQYLCLYRVGSVIKIQKSSDGNTWTDLATLTYSSSATLYNVTSVYNSGVLNDPQIRLE